MKWEHKIIDGRWEEKNRGTSVFRKNFVQPGAGVEKTIHKQITYFTVFGDARYQTEN